MGKKRRPLRRRKERRKALRAGRGGTYTYTKFFCNPENFRIPAIASEKIGHFAFCQSRHGDASYEPMGRAGGGGVRGVSQCNSEKRLTHFLICKMPRMEDLSGIPYIRSYMKEKKMKKIYLRSKTKEKWNKKGSSSSSSSVQKTQ